MKKKKKFFKWSLWLIGCAGLFLLLGGVGAMEIDSMSFIKATTWSVVGLIILAIVVFWGIPHYEEMPQKKL